MSRIYCNNCGKKGHVYKLCSEPVTSNGIICVCQEKKKELKYLLIRRRNSYTFVEFIRGRYFHNNISYIVKLLVNMSKKEQQMLKTQDFDKLWMDFWVRFDKRKTNEYLNAKKKLEKIREGYIYEGKLIKLGDLIDKNESKWDEPEWGFPKGRRNMKENNYQCANREFKEETNLRKKDYEILNINPIAEEYMGSNNVKYRNIYYVAKAATTKATAPKLEIKSENQKIEIGDIGWFTYEEVLKKIRSTNGAKKKVATKINELLVKFPFRLNV